MPAGKGFADLVFIPKKNYPEMPALILELKWNHSAQTAVQQIKDKKYSQAFCEYSGDILLVGINYDKKTKKHECVIEKEQKNKRTGSSSVYIKEKNSGIGFFRTAVFHFCSK